eukprot:TRINITY_DN12298_c0_g1_i1.p1 TRINITY_DN12298_c0_g1~~TRINITY_DN12298_c0_g1_i1.p1  ORF type:complete len:191 (+),score=55.78 TRINITY_DN12298_c0_g1_i1:66-575(+)
MAAGTGGRAAQTTQEEKSAEQGAAAAAQAAGEGDEAVAAQVAAAFDRILGWDQRQFDSGFEQGAADGRAAAERLAVQQCAAAGVAYGQRFGYIAGWAAALHAARPLLPERPAALAQSLVELLAGSDAGAADPEVLAEAEARFKRLMSNLGYRPAPLPGEAAAAAGDLSF